MNQSLYRLGQTACPAPKKVHPSKVSYLQTNDLKRNAARVLDAARFQPQFLVRDGAMFVIAMADAESALHAAAQQSTGLKLACPGLTEADRQHRNRVLRSLDDSEGW